jgi:hypothetical protein
VIDASGIKHDNRITDYDDTSIVLIHFQGVGVVLAKRQHVNRTIEFHKNSRSRERKQAPTFACKSLVF